MSAQHYWRTWTGQAGPARVCRDAARVAAATVLLSAGATKVRHPATAMATFAALFSTPASHRLILSLAACEMLLGWWLLVGVASRWSLAVASACFFTFSGVSLALALSGRDSCGCFGTLPVNPWMMLGIDLIVLLALLACQRWVDDPRADVAIDASVSPNSPSDVRNRHRLVPWTILGAGAAACMAYIVSSVKVVSFDESSQITAPADNRALTVIEPEHWLGNDCPILDRIDVGEQLKSGTWLIILVHHDCARCQQVVEESRWLATSLEDNETRRIAIIEVPPYGIGTAVRDETVAVAQDGILFGKLSDSTLWFVQTPAVLAIEDGRVVNVGTDLLHEWWRGEPSR